MAIDVLNKEQTDIKLHEAHLEIVLNCESVLVSSKVGHCEDQSHLIVERSSVIVEVNDMVEVDDVNVEVLAEDVEQSVIYIMKIHDLNYPDFNEVLNEDNFKKDVGLH